jgi:subfamily B ATP-binding cassette protein MsbA
MLERILGKDIGFYVKGHGVLIICAIVLALIAALLAVLPTFFIGPFFDEGMKIGSDPVAWKVPWVEFDSGSLLSWHRTERVLIENVTPNRLLIILSILAILSGFLKSVSLYFGHLATAAFSNRIIRVIRRDLFNKFIALPIGFFHKHKAGELVSRSTADIGVMQNRIANIIIGLVQHPMTALFAFSILLFMNWALTMIIVVAVPVITYLVRLFGRKVKKHAIRVQDSTAQLTSAYQETLLCLRVIQGLCMAGGQSERFSEKTDDLYKKVMHWNRWHLGLAPMMDSTGFIVLPLIILVGKIYFNHTPGELMAMFFAFSRVYAPVKGLAKVNNELQTLHGATARVFDIIRTVPKIQDPPNAKVMPVHQESIEFKNVSFTYATGEPVLNNISFHINAGEMAAFVGSTGAGKSTLIDLIPRFYDITDGKIYIDGMDIREAKLDSLRCQMGIVNQEVLLFHDTIINNITCGKKDITKEEIIEAAKVAHAHDFIMAQPEQYDTVIGDRGTLLSGGQKQRISIARAILIKPSILLLDEVASALDAESEKLVQDAIDELKGVQTILVVAHRLSTIRKADKVFVLENGRIVESGSHDKLLEQNGRFRQLYDMQFKT